MRMASYSFNEVSGTVDTKEPKCSAKDKRKVGVLCLDADCTGQEIANVDDDLAEKVVDLDSSHDVLRDLCY